MAVGDSHTLVVASGCTCQRSRIDAVTQCRGVMKCQKGPVLFAWGQNNYLQVDGLPSDFKNETMEPRLVPFFTCQLSAVVTHVAVCRSRSVAVLDSGEVYEWGYSETDDRKQFQMLYRLPERCTKVVAGTAFNYFLLKDQTVWASGKLSQAEEVLIDTSNYVGNQGTLINLNEAMGYETKFVQIEAGYSHLLLLDSTGQVFVYGSGQFGQLGQGPTVDVARYPMPVADINEVGDRVRLIACGPNYNMCYTEHGILYSWGMLVPDDFENIQWLPSFMPITFQKTLVDESFLHEFHLTDIATTTREVVACDSKGHLYHSDLLTNQSLKPLPTQVVDSAYSVLLSRQAMYFPTQVICLENSLIEQPHPAGVSQEWDEELPVWETLMDNSVAVRLCDQAGRRFYISNEMQVGVVFCFNQRNWAFGSLVKEYEYRKKVTQTKDAKYPTRHKVTDLNQISHLYQPAKLNPGDNSLLELSVAPDTDAVCFLHAFVVAGDQYIECRNSPLQIKIVKSDLHKQRLHQAELNEQEKARLEELNRLKRLKEDEERRRLKAEQEAAIAKKRQEIQRRGEELARQKKEEADRLARQAEEDRKMKKELRMGGGFNLTKYNEMKAAKK